MSKKDIAANNGFGGMFVIGLVFFVIGVSKNETFLPLGIVFIFTAFVGWAVYRRRRGKNGKATEDEGGPAEPKKSSGE